MFYSGSLFCRVLRPNAFFGFVGGCFTLISSTFLWRLLGHFALTAQWLFVFELLLIMKPKIFIKKDIAYQILLCFIAVGVHPYIAGMVVPLAVALCWKFYVQEKCSFSSTGLILALFFVASGLFAWFWGYFSSPATDSFGGGFSEYSTNLLTFINPTYGSLLLHPLPLGVGQYEGYAYLGLGLLIPLVGIFFLSFFKEVYSSKRFYSKNYSGLIWILGVYFLFALSSVIQVAGHRITLLNIHHFQHLEHWVGVFRSSGRFIWPVWYFIEFFVLVKIYDIFSVFPKKRQAIFLLMLSLQIADQQYLINFIKDNWSQPVTSVFKTKLPEASFVAAHSIQHVFLLNNINTGDALTIWMYFAMTHHLTLNKAWLGRTLGYEFNRYNQQIESDFWRGRLVPQVLYIGIAGPVYPNSCVDWNSSYVLCQADKK